MGMIGQAFGVVDIVAATKPVYSTGVWNLSTTNLKEEDPGTYEGMDQNTTSGKTGSLKQPDQKLQALLVARPSDGMSSLVQ